MDCLSFDFLLDFKGGKSDGLGGYFMFRLAAKTSTPASIVPRLPGSTNNISTSGSVVPRLSGRTSRAQSCMCISSKCT